MTLSGELISSSAHELAGVQQTQRWLEASELFLNSRNSDNTRAAYRRSLQELFAFTEKGPWDIEKADVQRWVDSLRQRELAPSTIRLRVSAISSFYAFVIDEFDLSRRNPASSTSLRPPEMRYKNSRYLSVEEAQALLGAIPQDTPRGLQDYALFLTYMMTGRRNSEVRRLRWGDIHKRGDVATYSWVGKGKAREDELPEPAYHAILHYLFAAGRMPLDERDYIFAPLTDLAANLPTVDANSWSRDKALSGREINRRLKMYARKAGLRTERLRVHSLRHTAAMLRRKAGDDLENISSLLNHSSLAITQVYLHSIEGRMDPTWHKVSELLGV